MADGVYRTRSLGVSAEGLRDQYADGNAAKVWEYYIGCKQTRTEQYRNWIADVLKRKGCQRILDAACGTGMDSILLLEEGFDVTSTDASDRMLKYALKKRWYRRKEPAFDNWVIEEGNWLTLVDDIERMKDVTPGKFDAVICIGNSFAHLPDSDGMQHDQKVALENFYELIKPGGVLVIDHRNYDEILKTGIAPSHNIYYNSEHITDIKCSTLAVNGVPTMVTLDYTMDMSALNLDEKLSGMLDIHRNTQHFRLSYYPHRLNAFSALLKEIFGSECSHEIHADFKPLNSDIKPPAYFIHVLQKAK